VSAALVAAMREAGEPVRAHKPVLTGMSEPVGRWPADHLLLASAAGMDPYDVAPLRFGPASSPHLAADLAGEEINVGDVVDRAYALGAPSAGDQRSEEHVMVVEGVGGLMVPLTKWYTVCDLATQLELPLIVVAKPGLGTINHTLLTLAGARDAGLRVAAVVLTPWPLRPTEIERSNRETIERMGTIEVATVEEVASADIPALARAGACLPWRDWLLRTSFVAPHP
jgi:dethiobiotin synthetase